MTVIDKEIPATLIADRRARNEDARVRYSLGLRRLGLRYGLYNATPCELYVTSNGVKYVKVSLGVYKPVLGD
jgi:hypothetical protein